MPGELLALLGIIVFTVVAYYPVVGFDFINLDDDAYVYQNEAVLRGLTLDGLLYALQTFEMANWMPMTWLSYMVDVELFGPGPGGFHLTNALIHLVNALLLFFFLQSTTGRLWRAAFVAALFAVHPLHVESVAWVSERKDVLSTLFWMLCLLVYARFSRTKGFIGYLIVGVLFILGLAAKPMLVTLPLGLLLIDYWPLRRGPVYPPSPNGRRREKPLAWRALFREKIPLLLISLVFGIITLIAQSSYSAVQTLEGLPLGTRLANALISYTGYLKKMIWPDALAVYYPYPAHIPLAEATLSAVFLMAVSLAAYLLKRRCPYVLFGWTWYLLTLLPVIGIIQVGSQSMADRYTYVPLIGIFIVITWAAADLAGKWEPTAKLKKPAALVIIIVLTIIANKQVRHWQDSVTLFSHTVAMTRDNYLAHSSLAMGYAQQGRTTAAIEHYRKAIHLRPADASLYFGLGNVYLHSNQMGPAIEQYGLALELAPADSRIMNNLAKALIKDGKVSAAISLYKRALTDDPDNPGIGSNFGAALVLQGDYFEAEKIYHDILRQYPGHADTHYNLGYLYELRKDFSRAADHYAVARQHEPEHRLAIRGEKRIGALKRQQPQEAQVLEK